MEGIDAAAVAQVLSGDHAAFRVLVKRHSRRLFHLAFRMTNNEHDAEDVVQEAFLRAFRQLNQFESRSNFSTWLYRIGVNCALDLMRSKRKHTERRQDLDDAESGDAMTNLPDEKPTPERLAIGSEIHAKIGRALSSMGEKERAAFVLRHFEGMSIEEVGSILGLGESAAKNSIFRAVQKLRRELQPMGNEAL